MIPALKTKKLACNPRGNGNENEFKMAEEVHNTSVKKAFLLSLCKTPDRKSDINRIIKYAYPILAISEC